jgi:hypothetical protein
VTCDRGGRVCCGSLRARCGVLVGEVVDGLEEEIGEEGFHAEGDVAAFVLGLGFFESADDEDGEGGAELAQLADELGAGHAGHDVVCDDETDLFGEVVGVELLEGALRVEGGDDEVVGPPEDGLAGGGLDGVVIY